MFVDGIGRWPCTDAVHPEPPKPIRRHISIPRRLSMMVFYRLIKCFQMIIKHIYRLIKKRKIYKN